jgi:hypothetical protein
MQITALILGIIGTLTGTISLLIKLIEFWNDRPKLTIKVELSAVSSSKFPIEYFRLRVIFINSGRRPVTMIDGAIDLKGGSIIYGGRKIPVVSAHKALFSAKTQQGLLVDSHGRKELVFEPFDARPLRDSEGRARAFFTDAIGNRYNVDFVTPDATNIVRIMAGWDDLRKKQKYEAGKTTDQTNPA